MLKTALLLKHRQIQTIGHGVYLTKRGNINYVELKGDVKFHDVDFGYTDEKIVLHDINLYAKPAKKLPL